MKLPALASIAVGVVLKARSGLTWSARYAGLLGTRAWAWIVVVLVLVVIGAAAQAGRAFLPDSGGATGAMLACALLLAGVGSVQLRSDLWRRGFPHPPAYWLYGPAAWRGEVRALPTAVAAAWLLLGLVTAFTLGELAVIGYGPAVWLLWLFFAAVAAMFLIVLFNRPKVLVPPRFRSEPGVL